MPAIVTRASGTWSFLDPSGARFEVAPRVRFAVNDPRAAVDVARLGVGMALVPVEAVAHGDPELVRLEPERGFGTPEPARVFAVHPSRRLLPLRVKLALEWLARA